MGNADNSNVIEIGDFRFARKERYGFNSDEAVCKHKHMTIDDRGDVITCDDCSKQLSSAWVLKQILDDYLREFRKLQDKTQALEERMSKEVHLIAARKVEDAWRRRDTVPACPHCNRGILATDKLGAMQISKRLELLRRERAKQAAESTETPPSGSSS